MKKYFRNLIKICSVLSVICTFALSACYFAEDIYDDNKPGSGGGSVNLTPDAERLEDLSAYLDSMPANTKETPYRVSLSELNMQWDFVENDSSQGVLRSDPLGRLLLALGDKYVDLDLSGCTGATIPASTPSVVSYRTSGYYTCVIVSLKLPATIKNINEFALANMPVYSADFSAARLENIAAGAFAGSKLESIILPASAIPIPALTAGAFTNTPIGNLDAGAAIYVPDDKVTAYQAADVWSTYASKIKPISDLD